MNDVKLVIVMRNDLNMRKGKMVAQGAHAASSFLLHKVDSGRPWSKVEREWLETGTKKICVRAETEAHLIELFNQAKQDGLQVHLITDSGLTEFDGPTRTCIAIGPDLARNIDPITGNLKLL